jgi:hypothetical protein
VPFSRAGGEYEVDSFPVPVGRVPGGARLGNGKFTFDALSKSGEMLYRWQAGSDRSVVWLARSIQVATRAIVRFVFARNRVDQSNGTGCGIRLDLVEMQTCIGVKLPQKRRKSVWTDTYTG